MSFDFQAQQEAWSAPPIEGIGYRSSAEALTYDDETLIDIAAQMWNQRYSEKRWRNHRGLWRRLLGLDSTHGKEVLDFGCGAGLEALEYRRAGNRVTVADISDDNLLLACRFFEVHGFERPMTLEITEDYPFIEGGPFEVIHCSGVLHHIPYPEAILERFADLLVRGGEVRLMVYSDKGWMLATGTRPPADTSSHPAFEEFVRYFDRIGSYADWYNRAKLEKLAPTGLRVTSFDYITPDRRYAVARMERR